MSQISAAIFGAGARGSVYARYALDHPDDLKIVAIAEPDAYRRERFARLHSLSPQQCYDSWQALLNDGKQADVLFNCTQDQMHIASTLAALEQGYDILLEKPMAHTLQDCLRLVDAADRQGRLLMICHVLRYTPFFRSLYDIVRSGRLGQIISVDHRENLVYWHMAHSFVRGNWRSSATSAPMILAKCCHDLDILGWILGQPVSHLSSFGSLTHFRPEQAPRPDVPLRCTDGCPAADDCKYEAQRLYFSDASGFPWDVVSLEASAAARLQALKTGPYGRCVYHCDNDVVDHQTVNMEFADGCTVTLTMNGQGYEEGRTMRYDGTRATLFGHFSDQKDFTIHDHRSGTVERIEYPGKRRWSWWR